MLIPLRMQPRFRRPLMNGGVHLNQSLHSSGLISQSLWHTARPILSQPRLATPRSTFRDFLGGEHSAGLFYVSPNQINAELPGGLALGEATFTINPFRGSSKSGYLRVEQVSPGIFTANGDVNGVPAAYILQVSPQGARSTSPYFDSIRCKRSM